MIDRKSDYDKARQEYITSNLTYKALSDKYLVPYISLYRRAKREGWAGKRAEYKGESDKKAIALSVRQLEAYRVSQVKDIYKALNYLTPYITGVTSSKPKSYGIAIRSYVELGKLVELLQGRATDIIISEIRDKKLLEIVHKLKTLDKPLLAEGEGEHKSLLSQDLQHNQGTRESIQGDSNEG